MEKFFPWADEAELEVVSIVSLQSLELIKEFNMNICFSVQIYSSSTNMIQCLKLSAIYPICHSLEVCILLRESITDLHL
jgi:hypothetical protein